MPIHDRIPREIFESILRLCVDSEKPVRDLENLQLVCRSWRDIIAEASFLWSTITTVEGRQAFHKALRMAKDSPLDIIFIERFRRRPSDLGGVTAGEMIDRWTSFDFFTAAAEKVHQWRSLEIQATNLAEVVLAFIQPQNPPPELEILHVEFEWNPMAAPVAVLFPGAPAMGLKHVTLICAPIDILPLGSTGLKSLILRDMPWATAEGIVTVLTNSPALTNLCLAEVGLSTTDEPKLSPIQLPFLVDLELGDLPTPFLIFLLSNLAVPQLRSLQVTDEPSVIDRLLALKTSNLSTTLTSVTSGAQNYEMTLHGGCEITIGGLRISLDSQGAAMNDLDQTFGGLSDHLKGLNLADLPLHLTYPFYLPVPSDLEWFTRKANVTSLAFVRKPWVDDDMDTVIPLLGQPTSGPSPIWLLPQLEVFKIDLGTTQLRCLVVDMIKARHAALSDSSPGAHGTVPKLLREIWLYHHGECLLPSPLEDTMAEVVQAAKGADVHWEGS
ncbi:hypothetical protein FRC00_007397 [Tulasnella sp. 408]|nr:hypothetical protein FRC00_007397 [Tulasnella sp. 408]